DPSAGELSVSNDRGGPVPPARLVSDGGNSTITVVTLAQGLARHRPCVGSGRRRDIRGRRRRERIVRRWRRREGIGGRGRRGHLRFGSRRRRQRGLLCHHHHRRIRGGRRRHHIRRRRQERVTDRWQPVGSGRYFFGCRRKEHVAAELPLESATATDPYAAALAGGGGGSIGQRRGRVAAVPADVESTRLRPVLEAAGEECPLD